MERPPMPKPETPDDPAPQPPTPRKKILPGAPQEEINAFFPPSDAAPPQPPALPQPPAPPAAAAARWTFEARQQLSLVVSGLPPPCLQDVVTIIFGPQTIQNGDEFTVDFAKLGVTICDRLQDYVEQQGTRVMQSQAGEPINDVPQIQRSPVSDEPEPKRQKAAASGTVGAAVRGRLPGRVVLDAKIDAARGAHSVVAAKGRLHLLLDDASLGLRWLDADAAEGHFKEHRAGVEAAARVPRGACLEVLGWLRQLDVSEPFARPVEGVPRYAELVSDPVDLGLIQRRLEGDGYRETGAAGFAADVRRVHANAALYCEPSPNADDVVVYRMAQVLRAAFEHKWRQVLEANIGRDTEAKATFAVKDEEVRKEAGDDDVVELQHVKPHAGDPAALVDKRVEVHWPRDKVWYAGVVTEYRAKDGRHRVDYDDGHSEWLDLNRPQTVYRIVGSSTFSDNKPQQDDSLLSVQKLGVLVWAKSGAHPWWPGELCLPAATKFMEALPPPRPGARMPRQRMVIYFGENQFDILPENAVVPLESRPEPRGKGTADLVKAYELALERGRELEKA